MNKEEFLEMRKEFGELVVNFDRFQKDCFILDLNYNLAFYDVLHPIRELELETFILSQALEMKEKNEKEEDITKYLDRVSEQFADENLRAENKNNYAKQVIGYTSRLSKEERLEVENIYADFMIENHPVVNLINSQEAKNSYETIKKFYMESNLLGLKEILDVQKKFLAHEDVNDEAEFVKYSQVYFETRQKITSSFNKQSKEYPMNKKPVFNDEMSIEREHDELKLHMKKEKEKNNEMHNHFIEVFGKDYSITRGWELAQSEA